MSKKTDWQFELEEYIRQGEPCQIEKSGYCVFKDPKAVGEENISIFPSGMTAHLPQMI